MKTGPSMDADAIALKALELPSEEWDAFVREACGGDDALYAATKAILAKADSPAGAGILRAAIKRVERQWLNQTGSPEAGTRLGAYELVRELGRGGMGEAYLAKRADQQYEGLCAIKVIRSGANSPDLERRFGTERQILARLAHPNICRLWDSGMTPHGQPFLVMEYVDGVPLLTYCEQKNLGLPERLALFLPVCDAVMYAHRNLVIHRDLKPGNILVAENGVPKLLDFGLAKLLGESTERTATDALMLTPEYASPEQVRGEPLTTATDVYSLGVLLYRLLTAATPYRMEQASVPSLLRAVCEQEPERPSLAARQTTAAHWARKLEGDLDTITLAALRKEPERRYESVERFSDDIRRYLANLPVRAHGDSWRYRTRKFLVRNRMASVFAAILVCALIIFAGVAAWQNSRFRKERDRAERISSLLTSVFGQADPTQVASAGLTARQLLDDAVERISKETAGDAEVRATLQNTMGRAYSRLGLYDKAEALFRKALAARVDLFGEEHPRVAESLSDLGQVRVAKGDRAEAERLNLKALSIRRKLLGSEHPETHESINNLATLYLDRGEYARAEPMYRELLASQKRIVSAPDVNLALTLNNMGLLLYQTGVYDEAAKMYQEALAMQRALYRTPHPQTALVLSNLAILLARRGDPEAAEKLQREALEIRRKLYGTSHPEIALNWNNIGALLQEKLDFKGAEEAFLESARINQSVFGAAKLQESTPLLNLGNLHAQLGRHADAERELRHVMELRERLLGPNHPSTALAGTWLSSELTYARKLPEARKFLERSLAVQRKSLKPGSVDLAMTCSFYGNLLVHAGEFANADPPLREALVSLRAALPEGHWRIANAENALGEALIHLGRVDEGRDLLRRSYPILLRKRGGLDGRTEDARARLRYLQAVE